MIKVCISLMADRLLSRQWWRRILFKLLANLSSAKKGDLPEIPSEPKKILILAPVLRGDYLMVTPLINCLRQKFPTTKIAVVVTKPSLDIASIDPIIDEVFLYKKLPGWFASIIKIIKYKPEIVFLPKPHPAFTESMLMALSGAPIRIGLDHPGHNAQLTHSVEHNDQADHRVHTILRLISPLGWNPEDVNHDIYIGSDTISERMAVGTISKLGKGDQLISINLSASNPSRLWTLEKWSELIALLKDVEPGLSIILLSAPAEKDQCIEIAQRYDFVNTIQTKSFRDAVAVIARTEMLISPDTGIVHAAIARKIPVSVLYNGDHEVYDRFYPLSVPFKAILAERGEDVASLEVMEVLKASLDLYSEIHSHGDIPA